MSSLAAREPMAFSAFPGLTLHLVSLERALAAAGELMAQLSAAERVRAGTIDHAGRHGAFVASRALLRELMSEHTGGTVAPADWVFGVGEHGKPVVESPAGQGLRFSTSHSGDLLAIAVSERHEVGVDIEAIADGQEVPWQVLTSAERKFLHTLPEDQQFAEFLRLWTIKEAYTKYLGTGATLDFREVEVDLSAEAATANSPAASRMPEPIVRQQVIDVGGKRVVVAVAAARAER